MEVKEAVNIAKRYVQDIFRDEKIKNVALEEVEFDEDKNLWKITIGFDRFYQRELFGSIFNKEIVREYKIVYIDDETKRVKSVKIRKIENV